MFANNKHIALIVLVTLCLVNSTTSAQESRSVVAWGNNNYGQCSVPEPNRDFIAVDGGTYYSIGLLANGSLVAWGTDVLHDDLLLIPEPNSHFITMSAAGFHWIALRNDGTIVERPSVSHTPPAPNPTFVSVAATLYSSLALRSDGVIVAWGGNEYGERDIPAPNAGFVAIAAHENECFGLKGDGSVISWGYFGSSLSRPADPTLSAIAAGHGFCLGLRNDGSIVAWGGNYHGQCDVPQPNSDFIAVAAGTSHSLGLKSDGTVVAWGSNFSGESEVPDPSASYLSIGAGNYHSLGISLASCVVTGTPAAPYQSIYEVGGVTTMELRSDILPQAANLSFDISTDCRCKSGAEIRGGSSLFAHSGTGRVYDLMGGRNVYFVIDNMTATGAYDLEIECADASKDTISANFSYVGYNGYVAEATLHNAITGNTIRGAGVSLWQWNGTGYDLYRTTQAGDGTYAFGSVPTGTYMVLIEYELDGEQWLGPYDIAKSAMGILPYEDVYLIPVTNDTEQPIIEPIDDRQALIIDNGVGLAVVEPVLGSMMNMNVWVNQFAAGAETVMVECELQNPELNGQGNVRCIDQLGNEMTYPLSLGPVPNTIQSRAATWRGDHVEISWTMTARQDGSLSYRIWRAEVGHQEREEIREPEIVEAGGSIIFFDRTARAGTDYDYDVRVFLGGHEIAAFSATVMGMPAKLALVQTGPNPFNPRTAFDYSLPEGGRVALAIYNVQGAKVATLLEDDVAAGTRHLEWDGTDDRGARVPSGVYFARLEAGAGVRTVKLTMAK